MEPLWTCWCKPCTAINYSHFNPEATGYRMNFEEFEDLIDKIILRCNHFKDIQLTKIGYILYVILQQAMFILYADELPVVGICAYFLILILFTITYLEFFIGLIEKKHEMRIKTLLKRENLDTYVERGLFWDIGPFCKYLHLKLDYQSSNLPLLQAQREYFLGPHLENMVNNLDDHFESLEEEFTKDTGRCYKAYLFMILMLSGSWALFYSLANGQ